MKKRTKHIKKVIKAIYKHLDGKRVPDVYTITAKYNIEYIKFMYGGSSKFDNGWNRIYVNHEDPEAVEYHEIGHWTGGHKQLRREFFDYHIKEKTYRMNGLEEVTAELIACCCVLSRGTTNLNRHIKYIAEYMHLAGVKKIPKKTQKDVIRGLKLLLDISN